MPKMLTDPADVALDIAASIGRDDYALVGVIEDPGDGTLVVENANGTATFRVTVTRMDRE